MILLFLGVPVIGCYAPFRIPHQNPVQMHTGLWLEILKLSIPEVIALHLEVENFALSVAGFGD